MQVARHPTLGQVLSDGAGRTLYVFTGDGRNSSTCDASCAQTWPPLKSGGSPRASEGVKADLLSTFTRPDGSLQVAYAGMPLYYFAGDAAPGDAKGQNVGGAWFVLSPMGEAVKPAAASTPAAPAPGPATPAADYGY